MDSRKFLLSLLGVLLGAVGLYLGLLEGVQFVQLVLGVCGLYITGNVAQKFLQGGTAEVAQK